MEIHFIESFTQRSTTKLVEVVMREKCYIKGEESNAKKKARDTKEFTFDTDS